MNLFVKKFGKTSLRNPLVTQVMPGLFRPSSGDDRFIECPGGIRKPGNVDEGFGILNQIPGIT